MTITPDLMPEWAAKKKAAVIQKVQVAEKEKPLGMFQFKTKIVWFNAIGFLLMHLLGVYGLGIMVHQVLFHRQIQTFLWVAFLVFLGGEGITIGAHRLWTHRSFKATLPLQLILIACQTLAGQNCCYIWARDHRQHHKYSDTDADPHNVSRGFFFSHIGWLMMKKHPDVITKGKGIDMSDLEANPVVMFQKKYYKPLYVVLALLLPVTVPIYLWGEDPLDSFMVTFFMRYIALLNITWCVNSVAHLYGTRPYDKTIAPVESTFVSFIGLGEGWHNYHHAFPWDYKASEYGMSLNGTTRIIEMFAKIGWAYDLREASNNMMVSKIRRTGDGSHPIHLANQEPRHHEVKDSVEYLNTLAETYSAQDDLKETNLAEDLHLKISQHKTKGQIKRQRIRQG